MCKEVAREVTEHPSKPARVWQQRKHWRIADARTDSSHRKSVNACVQSTFFHCLQLVKDTAKGKVFERDYRKGQHTEPYSMYAFLSSTCYIYLRCQLAYDYEIEYALTSCPVEQELLKLLTADFIKHNVKRFSVDLISFYDAAMLLQDDQYIYTL